TAHLRASVSVRDLLLQLVRVLFTFRFFFFFNDTATTEIYTLSLHDALPISCGRARRGGRGGPSRSRSRARRPRRRARSPRRASRSEEHTSELQSQSNLVCRLLLEKKKIQKRTAQTVRRPRPGLQRVAERDGP